MDKNSARQAKYEMVLRRSMASAEPYIIIWGPGRHGGQDYQKRKRVRNAIQAELPNGSVVFPEDPEVRRDSAAALGTKGPVEKELLQAMVADIVIALDSSAGVGEEVARYSAYPKVACKLFVVAPQDHKSGYQNLIRKEVCVRFVTSEEMVSCDKTTQMCIDHVRAWCVRNYAEE